jgi:hypothetical protein
MSFPLHLVPKPAAAVADEMVPVPAHAAPVHALPVLGLTLSSGIAPEELQAFTRLMQAEGLPLQPTRMIYDRLYAFERLALAHGSGQRALQQMALHLFDVYQSRGEWIGLLH